MKEGTIDIKDPLQMIIHLGVAEETLSIVVVEQSKEEDGEGHTDDRRVGVDRR